MTTRCCAKSNIANLAFKGDVANRVCLSCGEHWYGADGAVIRYTRKEWDAFMETAYENPAQGSLI